MTAGPTSSTKGFQDDRYRALVSGLIDARRKAGLSQEGLASRIRRHQQFVSRYETGERRLDIIEFIDIARALSCDLGDMIAAVPKAKS